MDTTFSPFVISALTDVISGGPGYNDAPPPIGFYRTGIAIKRFLQACGIEQTSTATSRVPALEADLMAAAAQPAGAHLIQRAIEKVCDPRGYTGEPEKGEAVREHLNQHLGPEGFEVTVLDGRAVLRRRATAGLLLQAFAEKTAAFDFDTVRHEFDRAIENTDRDPADAVTAACSILEAVCRSILVELGQPLPNKLDVSALLRAAQEPLRLSPGRSDLPDDIAADVRQVLGGLTTVTKGIGALRSHGGDAHGRERGRPSVDARISRLALHAASTVALFLIETWERQQGRALPNRGRATSSNAEDS